MKRLLLLALILWPAQALAVGECVWPNCNASFVGVSEETALPHEETFQLNAGTVADGHCLTKTTGATAAGCGSPLRSNVITQGRNLRVDRICGRLAADEPAEKCSIGLIYGPNQFPNVAPTSRSELLAIGAGTSLSDIDEGVVCAEITPTTLISGTAWNLEITDRDGGTCGDLFGAFGIVGVQWFD